MVKRANERALSLGHIIIKDALRPTPYILNMSTRAGYEKS